jgi:magnesium transporter
MRSAVLIPTTSKRTLDPTMLHILPTRGDHKITEPGLVTTDALWLDLLDPTSAEVTSVEEAIGAKLPTLGALSEIESLSRLRSQGGVLYMSTPSAAGRPAGAQTTPPIGFVLSTDRLVTVRFMPLPSFDAVVSKLSSSLDAPKSSLEVFTLLCEEIVDHVADILEQLARELNGLLAAAVAAEEDAGGTAVVASGDPLPVAGRRTRAHRARRGPATIWR